MKRVTAVTHDRALLGVVTLIAVVAALTLAACGDTANLTLAEGTGRQPTLPAPRPTLLLTENIAPAKGWPEDEREIKGWVRDLVMRRADATVDSADRITLLRATRTT